MIDVPSERLTMSFKGVGGHCLFDVATWDGSILEISQLTEILRKFLGVLSGIDVKMCYLHPFKFSDPDYGEIKGLSICDNHQRVLDTILLWSHLSHMHRSDFDFMDIDT